MKWAKADYKAAADADVAEMDDVVNDESSDEMKNDEKSTDTSANSDDAFFPPW